MRHLEWFLKKIQMSRCNAKIFKKHFLELSYNLVFKNMHHTSELFIFLVNRSGPQCITGHFLPLAIPVSPYLIFACIQLFMVAKRVLNSCGFIPCLKAFRVSWGLFRLNVICLYLRGRELHFLPEFWEGQLVSRWNASFLDLLHSKSGDLVKMVFLLNSCWFF